MIFFVLIFFLLLEFFVITSSLFWLFVILFFSFFRVYRISNEKLKNFLSLFPCFIILFFSFIFLNWLKLDFSGKQIYAIIITLLFFFLLWVYNKKEKKIKEEILKFLPIISSLFLGIWFFYSGILEYFFWKEILLFFITFLLLKATRKLSFKNELKDKDNKKKIKEESKKKKEENKLRRRKNCFIELAVSLILLEFAWVLSFLPINFLNLTFLWVIGFYLSQEFLIMISKDKYDKKEIILKISIALILSLTILISSTWRII